MFNNFKQKVEQGLKDAAATAAANYGAAATNLAKQVQTSTGMAMKPPGYTSAGPSSARTGTQPRAYSRWMLPHVSFESRLVDTDQAS